MLMYEVLIVEDSPTQAARLSHTLEQNGYKVTAVGNGTEALEFLVRRRPTIIISDIVMPGMDGFALCKKIKNEEGLKDIPVILLTALSDPEDVLRGLECGADNFITKPYDEHSLLTRLHHILVNAELRKDSKMQMGLEILFRGKKYFISSERQQILDLLLSTYEAAVSRSQALGKVQEELEALNAQLEERITEKTASLRAEIEERKRAEEKLIRSELGYRRLFEAAKDGILILDAATGRIVDVNQSMIDMLGYTRGDYLGRELWDIGPVRDIPSRKTTFDQLQTKEYARYEDLPFHTKDGGSINVEFVSNAYSVKGERVVQCNIRDITERKKLEEQLLQAQKMEAVGQLAGGIAHDFNNILSAITGYAHLLHDQLADEALRLKAGQIIESAERGAEVTHSLLAYSRKQVIRPAPVRINAMIQRLEKLLFRLIGEDIELRTTLADGDISVMADDGLISQVLMNLATNARDAMPHGGVLTISAGTCVIDDSFVRSHGYATPGTFALLTVSDTGVGMTKETAAKIFEPFFTTKGPGKGTGLGLSMAYGIIKQHDGFITVYSEPGSGTTFRIYLPLIETREEAPAAPAVGPVIRGGSETILVAEDDGQLRKLTEIVLTHYGYNVVLAENGEDAVNKFTDNKNSIQLLLLDMMMPKKGGKEAYEEIKKIRPDIKVLFATGYSADRVRDSLLEEGMNFVLKPVAPNDLLMRVREILDKG
jgi:PAS domain S-box-containing protein